ncbi:MAG TPA: hypothetical protein VFV38_32685 [Ktedonobacteraceae bacterium]|nr:hypothetical protein [Ktedonobacteraceae bacterium]
MITCERCGQQMPASVTICPSCGTISTFSQPGMSTPTNYNPYSAPMPSYIQGYSQQQQQQIYEPPSGYIVQSDYSQPYNAPPTIYPQQVPPIAVNVNIAPVAPVVVATSGGNSAAIIVEVLLNVFTGIYGVGWLMAGETTTGIILLVCSLLLYWPILVVGTIITFGLGLLCLGPLAIGAVILNAILLNTTIKRKTAYVMMQPMQMMPPR